MISGFVSLPRMPAIIRLRTSGGTISAMRALCSGGLRLDRPGKGLLDMRLHGLCYKLDDRDHHGVSELPVGLGIRDRNPPGPARPLKAHETRAFGWGQPSRPVARLLDEDLRAILVVSGRERPGDVIGPEQAETEPVAGGIVLRLVVLEILPELRVRVYFGSTSSGCWRMLPSFGPLPGGGRGRFAKSNVVGSRKPAIKTRWRFWGTHGSELITRCCTW